MSYKKSKPFKQQGDRQLATRLLELRDDYSVLHQDPDGYRLGKRYFNAIGSQLQEGVQEVFNLKAASRRSLVAPPTRVRVGSSRSGGWPSRRTAC